MLGAIVDVPELGIKNGRVIVLIKKLGGYNHLRVSFNPKDDEINPSTVLIHEDEAELVDGSKIRELSKPAFALGDEVEIRPPLNVLGVVSGIEFSVSGCTEYEVYYKTEQGIVAHTLPEPILRRMGTAATPGMQTGSMNRSVERRI